MNKNKKKYLSIYIYIYIHLVVLDNCLQFSISSRIYTFLNFQVFTVTLGKIDWATKILIAVNGSAKLAGHL